MRMEKSSGLQNFSENRMIPQISGLKQYILCGSQDASVMLFESIRPAVLVRIIKDSENFILWNRVSI